MYHATIAEVKKLHDRPLGRAYIGTQTTFVAGFRVQAHGRFELAELDHPVDQMHLDIDRADAGTPATIDARGDGVERGDLTGYKMYAVIIGDRRLVRKLGNAFHRATDHWSCVV